MNTLLYILEHYLQGVVCQDKRQAGAENWEDHNQHVDNLLEAEEGWEKVSATVVVAKHKYSNWLPLQYLCGIQSKFLLFTYKDFVKTGAQWKSDSFSSTFY